MIRSMTEGMARSGEWFSLSDELRAVRGVFLGVTGVLLGDGEDEGDIGGAKREGNSREGRLVGVTNGEGSVTLTNTDDLRTDAFGEGVEG